LPATLARSRASSISFSNGTDACCKQTGGQLTWRGEVRHDEQRPVGKV
jgi:hypothetical protein